MSETSHFLLYKYKFILCLILLKISEKNFFFKKSYLTKNSFFFSQHEIFCQFTFFLLTLLFAHPNRTSITAEAQEQWWSGTKPGGFPFQAGSWKLKQ